jgi:hypothetical protein
MSNVVKAPFGAAVALAGVFGLGGCKDTYENPYEAPKVPVSENPTGFSLEMIQKGDFFEVLGREDGAYKLTVPAEKFGGKPGETVRCILVKDEGSYKSYSGLSCDWSKLQSAPEPK